MLPSCARQLRTNVLKLPLPSSIEHPPQYYHKDPANRVPHAFAAQQPGSSDRIQITLQRRFLAWGVLHRSHATCLERHSCVPVARCASVQLRSGVVCWGSRLSTAEMRLVGQQSMRRWRNYLYDRNAQLQTSDLRESLMTFAKGVVQQYVC
jgi:hypothetical protein